MLERAFFETSLLNQMSRPSREFESAPTAEEAEKLVKRMSAGANVTEGHTGKSSAKEDEVLKVATFSLQKYLKVSQENPPKLKKHAISHRARGTKMIEYKGP